MGTLGLSVLLMAVHCVNALLDVDCVSSLDVECVSMSSSGSELVDFWEVLVDLLGVGESGTDFGISLSASSTAG